MHRIAALLAALAALPGPSYVAAAAGGGDGLVPVGRPPRRGRGPARERSSVAVVEDIERRVVQAGGNVEGVIVASLSWSTPDDLDLHVVVPDGAEISFQHRKAAGGELDVDMCVHGRRGGACAEHPVENVVFADEAPRGRFKVYVQNFNFHPNFLPEAMQVARMQEGGRRPTKEEQTMRLGRDRPVLFEVVVKIEGNARLFQGLCTPSGKTHTESNVRVFEFEYSPRAKSEEERLVPVYEAASDPACAAFQQRLLEAQRGPSQALPEGSAGSRAPQRRDRSGAPQQQARQGAARSAGGTAGSKGRRAKAWEETKRAALQMVRASSRDTLLSKPNKALQELLRDLGASCKGCLEKSEIVDRLLETAGVGGHPEEL